MLSKGESPPKAKNSKTFKINFMRTDNNNLFAEISNSHLNNMVKEVKETVASGIGHENSKTIFSAADLWNIQRMRRTRIARRLG